MDYVIAIAAAAGTVFVYLDMRHRRKKTDSRLWFWVNDLYTRQGLVPPKPPDMDDSLFAKNMKLWQKSL